MVGRGAMMMACLGWCGVARRGRRQAVGGHGRGLRGVGGEGGCVALLLARASSAGDGGDVLSACGLSRSRGAWADGIGDAAGPSGAAENSLPLLKQWPLGVASVRLRLQVDEHAK